MDYRTLEDEKPEAIHQCFKDSFSDYVVKVDLPFSKYLYHLQRYGVDLAHSMGSYDGDKLVGFILNATGSWHGKPTIYDAGTGMLKDYRGQGHSKQMFRTLVEEVLGDSFNQYLLEVIQGNDPAHQLYLKQGFTVQRELACFKQEAGKLSFGKDGPEGLKIAELKLEKGDVPGSFWDFEPSWQNHLPPVLRVPSFRGLGAYLHAELLGYVVFEPEYGDIAQLAVAGKVRGQGIATRLLKEAVSACKEAPEIKVLNIQMDQEETLGFFRARGFESYVDQYEMMLEL